VLKEAMALKLSKKFGNDLSFRRKLVVLIIASTRPCLYNMVDHNVAWPGVERHHIRSVCIGKLQVRNAANVQRHRRSILSKCHEVQILYKRRYGAT
jgi:hypothetical protein